MKPKLRPDLIVRVTMRSTAKGGKKNPIPPVQYGCPLFYEGEGFDCRLLLDQVGVGLEPGGPPGEVPLKFLCAELIKPRLSPGGRFVLWEAGDFADGVVLQVVADED